MSGAATKIYSVIIDNADQTLYEQFVLENQSNHFTQVSNIHDRLKIIGNEIGLKEEFFDTGAGGRYDFMCTLKDRPGSHLRLFFLEFNMATIILGGGGHKPKSARATQDVPKLIKENLLLREISNTLRNAEKVGHFGFNDDNEIISNTGYIYHTEHYE